MSTTDYDQIKNMIAAAGPAGFDELAERFIAEGAYPAVFEARLMRKRLELGLPLILEGPLENIPKSYEEAQLAAAREVGELFLRDGQTYRAWPYFRALGDPGPIREAIERFAPSGEEQEIDGIVEIAYHERVHPYRGFELILEHYGICRAITNFSHYPSDEGRVEAGRLLAKTLYRDLLASLKRTVEGVEGAAPETDSIADLVRDRDWLFDGANYFIDNSHVSSIVQMAPDWEDPEALRLVLDLTEYGRRLSDMYQFKGDAPFENVYEDVGVWVKAVLGEEQDEAVEHFRGKLAEGPDPYGDIPAQTLVKLLVRLERYDEAIDVAESRLLDVEPGRMMCPSPLELCQLAKDYERMKKIAEATGNKLAYAAAVASSSRVEA